MSNSAIITLSLALISVYCGRACAEQLNVRNGDGSEIAIGNYEVVDGKRFKLDLLPHEGHGFCRKKVLLFDVIRSRAISQDQSRWLFTRSDGHCEDVAASSYVEFEELEAMDIRWIDRFVEGVVRTSKKEALARDIKIEDPKNFSRCFQGADWKIEQLYQNPIAPDEAPEVVMKVEVARKPRNCPTNTLYLRGNFHEDNDEIIISIMSASAIAW